MKVFYAGLLTLLAACAAGADQTCDTQTYPLSAPSERFADDGDGTVTDKQSGLMWMRCSLGQSWNGSTCTGVAGRYSWQGAQDEAKALNQQGGYAKHDDWRMPHIPELAMIVERQCANPRINLAIFPTTPATYFWTATARRGKGMDAEAYVLSFGPEGAGHHLKDMRHYARLVRAEKRE